MIQLVTHFNILAGILRVPSFQHEKCEELWPLSRRNSRQESWFNLWVMKYEFWDVYETLIWQSQADWTPIIPIFPALRLSPESVTWSPHLCVSGVWSPMWSIMWCLTGSCNNHCIVSLVMIIINQSPQLLGVSPLCSLVSAWSLQAPAPELRTHHQALLAIHHQMDSALSQIWLFVL